MSKKEQSKKEPKTNNSDDGLVEIVFDIEKLKIAPHVTCVYGIQCEVVEDKMVGRCEKVIYDAMKSARKCD